MMDRRAALDLLRAESSAWALAPDQLDGIVALLAHGQRAAARGPSLLGGTSATAVIKIVGPLVRRGGLLADFFGFASYASIRSAIAQAVADKEVTRIVLYVDSPGGAALGCEECADDIARAGHVKPVTAFVDGMAASAGYWLAASAGNISASPSSVLGSIGVFILHMDASKMLADVGIRPTFIVSKASPHKVDGNSYQPLSKDARDHEQQDVDAIASKFIASVARGRRVSSAKVRADFGQGRTLFAEPARAAGMIDGIASSLKETIGSAPSARTTASADFSHRRDAAARRLQLERLR
jgi:signal peptide peptidase SppA